MKIFKIKLSNDLKINNKNNSYQNKKLNNYKIKILKFKKSFWRSKIKDKKFYRKMKNYH